MKKSYSKSYSKPLKSMSSPTTLLNSMPFIVYYTEGTYRPICVITIKNSSTWITPNIAFYRSSGLSNDRFQQKYLNTWFPCVTIIEEDLVIGGKTLTRGFIFKMSTFLEEPAIGKWACQLLNRYFENKYINEFPEYVKDILTEATRQPSQAVIKAIIEKTKMTTIKVYEIYQRLLEEYHEIHEFISGYFLHDWQLMISAIAGTGYWRENNSFHNYVLSTIEFDRDNFELPSFDIILSNNDEPDNTNLVIDFLKTHQCFPSVEQLNANVDDYRRYANSICSSNIRYKYIIVNKRIEELHRAIAISKKYL